MDDARAFLRFVASLPRLHLADESFRSRDWTNRNRHIHFVNCCCCCCYCYTFIAFVERIKYIRDSCTRMNIRMQRPNRRDGYEHKAKHGVDLTAGRTHNVCSFNLYTIHNIRLSCMICHANSSLYIIVWTNSLSILATTCTEDASLNSPLTNNT